MSRRPRIHFPGAVYHVMVRGNAGLPVFFIDADRLRFYLFLQEAIERFECRVHAFCCMTTHIHLAIQIADISLSRIMQNLSVRYTAWINRSHHRAGHLFQGRFKAILIDADNHLLELVRYIHLNPVRAAMVTKPGDYPWSGHRAYLGLEVLPWLTTDWVLSMLSAKKSISRRKYCQFVAEGLTDSERQELHGGSCDGRILGSEDFVDTALRKGCQRDRRPVSFEEMSTEEEFFG